jgi:LmbE family N-acetylglucosaminyl deacetylase
MLKRIIGVAAHPDDLEWYAGATLAKLASTAEIIFVICTNGDKGTFDSTTDPHQLAAQRRAEQMAAAQVLGVRQVIFLDHPDGELAPTLELRARLAQLYRQHRPELLLAFDPWKRYELHPDHLAAGRLALDARLAAKLPLFNPELRTQKIDAWAIPEIWLFNADAPNFFIDVSETMDIQMRALEQHRSQTTVWDAPARTFLLNAARENGKAISVPYAETFRKIVIEGAMVVAEGTET